MHNRPDNLHVVFFHMHHTMFFQVNLGEALFLEAIQNLNQN